jgi:hypothetical protein
MGIDTSPSLSLKKFLLTAWIWHFLVTLVFMSLLVMVYRNYSDISATRTDFLINLIAMPLCWTHTILILIFSMRRFARKQPLPGLIYLGHFFGSAVAGYYLYVILMLFGWAYTMKGH